MTAFTTGLQSLMFVVFMWWCMDTLNSPAHDNDNSRAQAVISAIGISAVYLYYGQRASEKNKGDK